MHVTRREVLRGIGAAATFTLSSGFFGFGSQKVKLAVVGVMGKGFSDWTPMLKTGNVEIVALCDCDERVREKVVPRLTKAGINLDVASIPFYTDYRKLMDDADKLGIEAMTVSTPDHNHAAPAILAMKQGIHCFVQKPLVRTQWELDYFTKTAKDKGVIVQMGNQGSSLDSFRRNVEIFQSGILGDVTEIHVWTNRPVWPQGAACKEVSMLAADSVPSGLDWDAWLGGAKPRPYKAMWPSNIKRHDPWGLGKHVYHDFGWRGFQDFGTGALGDMACHTFNLPFRAFELGSATRAECTYAAEKNDVGFPTASVVEFKFSERISQIRAGVRLPAVKLFWYDGDQMFNSDITTEFVSHFGFSPRTGVLMVGSKGMALQQDDYGGKVAIWLRGDRNAVDVFSHEACKCVPRSIPFAAKNDRVKQGFADSHYSEFVEAIRGRGPVYASTHSRCYSDIESSEPLISAILTGVTAQRVGGLVTWDSALKQYGSSAANNFLRPYIRKGYEY